MSDKDGGQAFPVSLFPGPMGDLHAGEPGMTLRDWFAAQALVVVITVAVQPGVRPTHGGPVNERDVAASAYLIADAMLAERTKP